MKVKITESIVGRPRVELQVQQNQKWYDFGYMDFQSRDELADILEDIASKIRDGSEIGTSHGN